MTVDPLVDETGQPYAYTADDPVNGTDPLGLYWGQGTLDSLRHQAASNLDSTWNGVKSFATGLAGTPRGCGTNGAAYDAGNISWWADSFFGLGEGDAAADAEDGGTSSAARGGETAEAAYGRAMHADYDYGPGFEKEMQLENGKRADAVNLTTREVLELKPNNPAAIARGLRQAQGYAQQLNDEYPGTPFTYRVITYDRP